MNLPIANMGTPWPADKVERRQLLSLIPFAKNARTHNEGQVKQIAASMREWGWTNPILVDEASTIIAGHARVMAAQSLGWTDAPVMVATGWSEAQKRAYVLADNKLALNAGWDAEMLGLELGDLEGLGFDVSLIGFSADELLALKPREGLTDPDQVPEPPAEPVTQAGDLWLLGPHRLVCGDCTEAATVATCLGGSKPHLMVTDPPYGVEYDPDWRPNVPNGFSTGHHALGKVSNDQRSDWTAAWKLFPGDVAYVWHAGQRASVVDKSLGEAGFVIRSQIIWRKQVLIIGRGNYHFQHEPCWYAVRKGATAHWQGDRKQSTIWDIDNVHRTQGEPDDGRTEHSTQKPVECMRRPMVNNAKAGDRVYDPFVGSGTSIIAAEMTGRICHGIEIDPVYVDVAVKRWEDFTGNKATLERTKAAA